MKHFEFFCFFRQLKLAGNELSVDFELTEFDRITLQYNTTGWKLQCLSRTSHVAADAYIIVLLLMLYVLQTSWRLFHIITFQRSIGTTACTMIVVRHVYKTAGVGPGSSQYCALHAPLRDYTRYLKFGNVLYAAHKSYGHYGTAQWCQGRVGARARGGQAQNFKTRFFSPIPYNNILCNSTKRCPIKRSSV